MPVVEISGMAATKVLVMLPLMNFSAIDFAFCTAYSPALPPRASVSS